MNAESSEVLSRHALWRHDCLNATCSSVRTAHFAMCVAERRHSENMRCAQEPEVEAGNLALWLAHDAEIAPCETESLSASETGTLGVERDRLFFWFSASFQMRAWLNFVAIGPQFQHPLVCWSQCTPVRPQPHVPINAAVIILKKFVMPCAVGSMTWRRLQGPSLVLPIIVVPGRIKTLEQHVFGRGLN